MFDRSARKHSLHRIPDLAALNGCSAVEIGLGADQPDAVFPLHCGMASFCSDPHNLEIRAPTLGILRVRAGLSRTRPDRDTKSNRQNPKHCHLTQTPPG
jgi:hypothetical protein